MESKANVANSWTIHQSSLGLANMENKEAAHISKSVYGKVQLVNGLVEKKSDVTALLHFHSHEIYENPLIEADILQKLRGVPGIIQVVGESTRDQVTLYLRMQYAVNGDMFNSLSNLKRAYSEQETIRLFKRMANAVYEIHRRNICHLDISLENFLLDEHMCPLLADFGFAREGEHFWGYSKGAGKTAYFAPEIFSSINGFNGKSVDVFALGVCLFMMIAGFKAFDHAIPGIDPRYKIMQQFGCAGLLGRIRGSKMINQQASSLIDRMLCHDPKQRCTIEDVLKDPWLNECQDMENTPS